MKNVFKFLGIAFVACSMLVACGEDTETFTIKVKANPSDAGTVTGGGKYENGATATLEATANAGYTFVEWEDGSKNNPRLVTVTADAEYTANFAEQSGVKIQFGSSTWNAQSVNAQTNGSAYLVAAQQSSTSDYPFGVIFNNAAPATGTFHGDYEISNEGVYEGSCYMQYYESQDRSVVLQSASGNRATGDWWAKDLVLNVSAFDADAMSISMIGTATMGDVYAVTQGTSWESAPTTPMTMTCTGVTLTSVKGPLASYTGKLVRK